MESTVGKLLIGEARSYLSGVVALHQRGWLCVLTRGGRIHRALACAMLLNEARITASYNDALRYVYTLVSIILACSLSVAAAVSQIVALDFPTRIPGCRSLILVR